MIESLIRAKRVNDALYCLRVLHMSIFDMMLHQPENQEAIEPLNIAAAYSRLRKNLAHMDGPEALGHGDEWRHG
jgi:metallopeptidase MepB